MNEHPADPHPADTASMEDSHDPHHLVPYRLYVTVWAALIGLTGITVGVKYANLQHLAIFTAITIATVKAYLVLMYFMHIRYESRLFAVMILVFLVTFGTFIGLTFVDYPFR